MIRRIPNWSTLTRRTLVTAAMLVAAVVAPVGAAQAQAAATTSPPCAASALRVSTIRDGAAAGSTYYNVRFTNATRTTCHLFGYPGIVAFANARQLGAPAGRNPGVPRMVVTIAPGATAHSLLQITNAGNYPAATCRPALAEGIRVIPPNTSTRKLNRLSFQACSSGIVYMFVSPVGPGA